MEDAIPADSRGALGKQSDVRRRRAGRENGDRDLSRAPAFGEPVEHSLLTDGFAMAGNLRDRPALHEALRHMARRRRSGAEDCAPHQLRSGIHRAGPDVDVSSLERIDVVDISSDILEMSSLAFPDPERTPFGIPGSGCTWRTAGTSSRPAPSAGT